MSSDQLAEGTAVRILQYDKRPEFSGKEAEIGNFKDNTYECWMTDDAFEGSYALCTRDQIEVMEAKPAAEPAKSDPVDSKFGEGDRVRGKETGKLGTVTTVDEDGDPKVQLDGEAEAQQRFGDEFEVVHKKGVSSEFNLDDRVRGKDSGKIGTVVSIDEDGDPKVKVDGDDEALQRLSSEWEVVERAVVFNVGDRVMGKETKQIGTVTSVDEDGDPKVKLDGESEAVQRFANEYEIVAKGTGRDQSRSQSGDKKKSKKKKKDKSSSSSSGSSSSKSKQKKRSRSGSRKNARKSAFGRSTMEQREDEKRKVRKAEKKLDKGANAALSLLGLR